MHWETSWDEDENVGDNLVASDIGISFSITTSLTNGEDQENSELTMFPMDHGQWRTE